jgi:hypothetical protein
MLRLGDPANQMLRAAEEWSADFADLIATTRPRYTALKEMAFLLEPPPMRLMMPTL